MSEEENTENIEQENEQRVELRTSIIVTVSPKKRKLESPPSNKQKYTDDDGSTCSVCFEAFTSAGEHRLISLKCGHIYGESCILIWMKDKESCPQCKKPIRKRDIRPIYANQIQCMDNARENELEIKIRNLEFKNRQLAADRDKDMTTIILQRRQIKELQEELERVKSMILNRNNSGVECIQTIRGGRMYLEKNIDFKNEADSRMIKYLPKGKKLLIVQKSVGSNLFTGYGMRIMDGATFRSEKFVTVSPSNKPVMDFSIDQNEVYFSMTTREQACKVYTISNFQSFATITQGEERMWSTSFNKDREQHVLFGSQSGKVHFYDLRNPNTPLLTSLSLDNQSPVKFILSVNKTENFPYGGFFVIHIRGIYFYESQANLECKISKLNVDFSIVSASYDSKTEMLLISTPGEHQTAHVLMRLIKVEDVPVLQEIYRIQSNSITTSRPAQIKVPDGFVVISYANDLQEIHAHTPSIGKLHTIPTQSAVVDFCPIYDSSISSPTFAALSLTKCRIYKMNLNYDV